MEKVFVGLDVHKQSISACAIDVDGNILAEKKLPFSESMVMRLAEHFGNATVALEACRGYELLYDTLSKHGVDTRVANPLKLKMIAQNRLKCDERDARALAQLTRVGFLPEIWVPPKQIFELRRMCAERRALRSERTREKNRIRYELFMNRVEIEKPFNKVGLQKLATLNLPKVNRALARLELVTKHMHEIESEIDVAAEPFAEQRELLRSIPGIGEVASAVMLATIGDVTRFPNPKKLCAYAGLVPSSRSSGEAERNGGITREGSRELRGVLVECAHVAVRVSERFRADFERIASRRGKKRAYVAIARKLLHISWFVLTRRKQFREGVSVIPLGR